MSTTEYSRKLDELDRLLNDPDVPMQPDRIWSLLADVSHPEAIQPFASSRFNAGYSEPNSILRASFEVLRMDLAIP